MEPRKDLLDITSLTDEEIRLILDHSRPFKELFTKSVKKVPALRGKTVLTLFYEPSTRTRTSFEIAANRLSADVTNFSVESSSVQKGETVKETIDTLQAMKTDYIIVRHQASGIANVIANQTRASVINAGDGWHSHPTQALLDAFTLKEVFPTLEGRRILLAGDILHSRVARSTTELLRRLGCQVAWLAPGSLLPIGRDPDIARFRNWQEGFAWKPEVIYLLRVQQERQEEPFFPSLREYHQVYGLTDERLKQVSDLGLYVMHPAPVNRGVELSDAVMTYERTLINQQAENGIAVRMAVLCHLKPGKSAR